MRKFHEFSTHYRRTSSSCSAAANKFFWGLNRVCEWSTQNISSFFIRGSSAAVCFVAKNIHFRSFFSLTSSSLFRWMCRWTLHDHQQEDQQQHRRRLHFQAFFVDNKQKEESSAVRKKERDDIESKWDAFLLLIFLPQLRAAVFLSRDYSNIYLSLYSGFSLAKLFLLLLLRSPLPSKKRSTFDHMLIWLELHV